MSICVNHTDRQATTRCSTCHKPICDDCTQQSDGKIFCSQFCIEGAARFQKNFKPDSGPGFFEKLKNYILALVGLAAIFAVLVYIGGKIMKIGFCIKLLNMVGL